MGFCEAQNDSIELTGVPAGNCTLSMANPDHRLSVCWSVITRLGAIVG